MAQPSVAREPSMEEILASIRRIIESNDPESAKLDSTSLPPVYEDEDDDLALAIDEAAPAMHAANDRGAASVQAVEPAEKPAPKNISLADLAARVRSSSERVEQSEPVAGRPVEASSSVSPVMTSRMAELRSSVPQVEPEREASANAAAAAETFVMTDVRAEAIVEAPEPAAPSTDTESKALVSAETHEHVARSFGELAEAIDGSQRRSLDEMAEEMLRPMLQEWLDDNLPTLVERLVREEIERVARGPRR
ncbi:PopZ family protein [Ciceribacter thiooxidans]|uniref:PopZ family protein n=1 Tax=Ciceribacter thiooxidans TaxID=1969821 RepID=A0ABV7HZL4_9HYPH|nr:PopZ family protein [Ciceribacter thiooxidans]